jgi:exodeoxyribonuclease VII large subunit
MNTEIYSVTRLNREVRAVLEGSFRTVWVKGEISNLATPASGHLYFSLKDEFSQVRCAMFKNRNRLLKFKPQHGDEILVQANVSLYEGRGEFQLIVQTMEPAGLGALQRAFEQLKEKLLAEGLFDDALKKPVPEYPGAIGVITSPTGAAIRDILTTLKRRYPLAGVVVYPVPVQGATAAAAIAAMLGKANARNEVDVLILARGGGSLEDLWSFNEEIVARAIHASEIPVVTGIGHEVDFTIADFAADLRAPTPTSAAEHVSRDVRQIHSSLESLHTQMIRHLEVLIRHLRQQTTNLYHRLPHPQQWIVQIQQRLDDLNLKMLYAQRQLAAHKSRRLADLHSRLAGFNPKHLLGHWHDKNAGLGKRLLHAMQQQLKDRHAMLGFQTRQLEAVSPLATLSRGYSVTLNTETRRVLRDISDVQTGERITTLLSEGELESEVVAHYPDRRMPR